VGALELCDDIKKQLELKRELIEEFPHDRLQDL
jgi:hypothetical protein